MNISCAFVSIILISLPPPDLPPLRNSERRRTFKKRQNAGVVEKKAKSRRDDGGIRWLRDGGDRKERSRRKESQDCAVSLKMIVI